MYYKEYSTSYTFMYNLVLSFLKFESKLCESVCHIIHASKNVDNSIN